MHPLTKYDLRPGHIFNRNDEPVRIEAVEGTKVKLYDFVLKTYHKNWFEIRTLQPIKIDKDLFFKIAEPFRNSLTNTINEETRVIGRIEIQWYDDTQKRIWVHNNYIGIVHIEYINELQDLYHALTRHALELSNIFK